MDRATDRGVIIDTESAISVPLDRPLDGVAVVIFEKLRIVNEANEFLGLFTAVSFLVKLN